MKKINYSSVLFVAAVLPACVADTESFATRAAASTKEGEPSASQVSLFNGYPISGLTGITGSTSETFRYSLEMAPWSGDQLTFALQGPNGDADLYVKRWQVPTNDNYDCAPFIIDSSDERCDFTSDMDGTHFYVNLDGFAAYSGAVLHAYYTHVMNPGSANNFIWGGSNLSRSSWRLEVPAGKSQLRVKTTALSGTNVPNIYLRYSDVPQISHAFFGGNFPSIYDCKGTVTGGINTCAVNSPAAGTWYVMLEGVSTYNVTVEATTITRR
jgi:hypothetical protein